MYRSVLGKKEYSIVLIHKSNIDLLSNICKLLTNIIAVDTETALTNLKSHSDPPSIVQFGTSKNTFILDTRDMTSVDNDDFHELMRGPTIKVGFEIGVDVKKLRTLGVEVNNTIDNQTLAELLGFEKYGMDYVASTLLGHGKLGSSHDWTVLKESNIHYAARDVILSIKCYHKLIAMYEEYIYPYIQNALLYTGMDVFDLTVHCVNQSKHHRNATSSIRDLIDETIPITKQVLKSLMLKGLVYCIDNIYHTCNGTVYDISLKEPKYKTMSEPTPDHPMFDKLKYYQELERLRPFTPEERSEINIIRNQPTVKTVSYDDIDPLIVQLLPRKTQHSELKSFQDLILSIKKKEDTIKELENSSLTRSGMGILQQTKESLAKDYRTFNQRLTRYNLQASQFGM